jgi:hypothetical protein
MWGIRTDPIHQQTPHDKQQQRGGITSTNNITIQLCGALVSFGLASSIA